MDLGAEGRDPVPAGPFEITDANILEAQPRVRALWVTRLEAMYRVVQARITADEAGDAPIDPRMLEIGLRIQKEEALLYRLNRLTVTPEDEDEQPVAGEEVVNSIEAQLQELENKERGTGS